MNKVLQKYREGNSQLPRGLSKNFIVEVTFVLKADVTMWMSKGKTFQTRMWKSSAWLICRAVVFTGDLVKI